MSTLYFCRSQLARMIWAPGTSPTTQESTHMSRFSAIASLLAASAFNSRLSTSSQRQTRKLHAAQLNAAQRAGK